MSVDIFGKSNRIPFSDADKYRAVDLKMVDYRLKKNVS
jgi:hypothetical protein